MSVSRFVLEGEVVVCKLREPVSLSTVQLRGLLEVLQVLVISEDLDNMLRSQEILTPLFQRMHDGQQLLVIDLIVAFCHGHSFGKIGDRAPFFLLLLRQNGSDGKV